jgi:hypothetical protein
MVKITNLSFAFLLLIGGWQVAQAQAPMSSYDYYNMRQVIVNGAMANKAGAGASKETIEAVAIGEKRIKAGKASLTFIPTQAGLERFTKGIQFDPDEPQTLPEQITYAKNYVKRFNEMLTTAGGKVNDCADAYALAYATSYMAYYGKSPDKADIKTLRQKYIEENMKSEYFQGLSDADRQWFYNSWALMSLQALDERDKADQANSPRERKEAEEKAKQFAKYALEIK